MGVLRSSLNDLTHVPNKGVFKLPSFFQINYDYRLHYGRIYGRGGLY